MTRQLPAEFVSEGSEYLLLLRDERDEFERAKALLLDDLRFEHLDKKVDDAVWHFLALCHVKRDEDHVQPFIEQHRRELLDTICYIPVEHLRVGKETEFLEVRLLPIDHGRVPPEELGFILSDPVGCVAEVGAGGTSYQRMAERARAKTSHSLRVLRVALREHRGIPIEQLRFRLGPGYSFGERMTGWRRPAEQPWDLEIGDELVALALAQPEAKLPAEPTCDLERRANLALRWIERAWLSGEPITGLLYLFFALEALLGDKSEGLKAEGLAFRQAMLGHIITGGFTHPSKTYFLYDEVRSAAVHGEDPPAIEWVDTRRFAWEVRRTLNQFLSYAEANGFKRRSRLLRALDAHPDNADLVNWLREHGGDEWSRFLAGRS